jgi:hypothetical protein
LAFSAHLFSFLDILYVFLCSFKFLCFLEYWNIFLRYCAWKSYSVCVGLIFIYLSHFDCYICLCIFGIQLIAVIIPHCFRELIGSNLSWLWYFWKYFYSNIFRNMSANGSQHNVRQMDHLENRLLLKSYAQIPRVPGFRWAFSSSSCRAFHSIFLH